MRVEDGKTLTTDGPFVAVKEALGGSYGFLPQMGEAVGAVTERCRGIPLGRTTYEM